jgi:hypothetical protein
MGEALYVARSRIELLGSLHRRAHIATGATAEMGVHGEIQRHFGLSPARELPLPVDYIVAATGG